MCVDLCQSVIYLMDVYYFIMRTAFSLLED